MYYRYNLVNTGVWKLETGHAKMFGFVGPPLSDHNVDINRQINQAKYTRRQAPPRNGFQCSKFLCEILCAWHHDVSFQPAAAKPNNPPRARATMYGLSTLRRDGDVSVNVMNSHTTVKTKFFVGPLTLKVEKEVNTVYNNSWIIIP